MKRARARLIGSPSALLAVDQTTGRPTSLVLRRQNIDFLSLRGRGGGGTPAGVRICDESSGVSFSELHAPAAVVDTHFAESAVSTRRSLPDSAVDIEVTYELREDSLRWAVRLIDKQGGARPMAVSFLLPVPPGWQVWAPTPNAPRDVDHAAGFDYSYLVSPQGSGEMIHVPMLSIYQRSSGAGVTVTEDLRCRFPGVRYSFRPSSTGGATDPQYLEVTHPHLALPAGGELETSVLIAFHEGDWRPGLGWLYRSFPDYFDPGVSKIDDQIGTFLCGNIRLEDSWETYTTERRPANTRQDRMKRLKSIGLRFMEIHDHFPFYGLYAPEAEPWDNIARLEHPDSEIGFSVTYQAVRDFIDYLHDHGIHANPYFQFSQCYDRYAEEKFPESICRDQTGEPIPAGWPNLYAMNPDLSLPWGQYCLDQVDALLEAYPAMDGLFLDCFRHCDIDFAHDDGITRIGDRPCYNVNFAYDKITEAIASKLRARGLVNLANKPATIQQMKGVDCVLMETRGRDTLARQFYLCIARPMIYMWMDGSGMEGQSEEQNLRHCLLYGAFPQVSVYHNAAAEEQWDRIAHMYQAYLPLLERLRGRRLAFVPHPLELPPGIEGNLFTNTRGDYLVALISAGGRGDVPTDIEVGVDVGEAVAEARVMRPGDKAPIAVEMDKRELSLRLMIPGFAGAALVELLREGAGNDPSTMHLRQACRHG